jgi:outer membrane protein OmpA-like peptidoglycan-associated protein
VSADGSVFVYAAEAYDSRGAEDLYVSLKNTAGQWSEPRNLGSAINSTFQELSPWLSSDKRYLYFSSNGRKGYGSFDIYFSERLDDTWTNWSAPSNMGSKINTEGRELFYHTFPDLHLALFSSTQNSDGYGDIKFYIDSIQSNVPDTLVKIVEIKHENVLGKDEKHSTVTGTVTNSKTGQPVAAKLKFRSAKALPETSDSLYTAMSNKEGVYSLRISSTNVYTIVLEAVGYVGILEKLDIHTFEMQRVELNFKLQPIEVGATVNLKNVLFTVGTTALLTESYDELNVVVNLLKTNPKIEIELAGHTDNRGDARKNLKLSQSRVDKVKAYLVSKGIPARRIKGKGYGGQRPIANSESEESRKLNRRVEFTIVRD